LLIRETARHRRLAWPSIVVLALAYGVVEEGLVTMPLFNPNYAHLRLLDNGFVPFLGIGVPWTLAVLALHAIWSISLPNRAGRGSRRPARADAVARTSRPG
jgi:hypothetical protein